MKHLTALLFALVFTAGSSFPQSQAEQVSKSIKVRSWGSGYAAWGAAFYPNSRSGTGGNFGLGVDIRVFHGLGAGGELGMATSRGDAAGLASLNSTYHFARSPFRYQRMVPFVTGGYTTLGYDGYSEKGGNIGGGITWWFRKHLGLRMELRDYFFEHEENLLAIRAGISFR